MISRIPLKVGNQTKGFNIQDLVDIMEPTASTLSEDKKLAFALKHNMFPVDVQVQSETYSRDAERTANYELEDIQLVNAKSKLVVTWSHIKYEYISRLLVFLGFTYTYDTTSTVDLKLADTIQVTYHDFIGERTMDAYLGQKIEGNLKVIRQGDPTGYLCWETLRLSFIER